MGEAAGRSLKAASGAAPAAATAESERILLLECRLEKLSSALDQARADADRLRGTLAEVAAREADHARRYSFVHQELAEARAEIASLAERLGRSEALRAELEGHLFEAGARSDAGELIRLRRELLTQRQRSLVNEQTASRLRARVDELLISRETLLTRIAEWQRLVRKEEPGAVDLAEFIAELRRDILYLEHRNATSERQEAVLRERLARAGVDPDAPLEDEDAAAVVDEPAGAVQDSAHAAAKEPATTWESDATHFFEESFSAVAPDTAMDFADADPAAVVQNGPRDPDDPDSRSWVERSDTANDSAVTSPNGTAEAALAAAGVAEVPGAFAAVAPVDGLNAADPAVRAAAYERLTRILEGSPAELAGYLRSGLADADPRVRRRAVLAAATAGQLALRPLLEPLRTDPDPQVRRVVREVLRHAPGVVDRARSGGENRGLGTGHSVLKGASVHAEPFDFAE